MNYKLGILSIGTLLLCSNKVFANNTIIMPEYKISVSMTTEKKTEWTESIYLTPNVLFKKENIPSQDKTSSSGLQLELFQKDNKNFIHFVTGSYTKLQNKSCLLDKIQQNNCITEYKFLDNQFIEIKNKTEKIPLVYTYDNKQHFLYITLNKTLKNKAIRSQDIIKPPKYKITLKLNGDMLPNHEQVFNMIGSDGEELAYGTSIMKKYIPKMMSNELNNIHYGTLGEIILKPFDEYEQKKMLHVSDNSHKDITALIGVDVSYVPLDYVGYGDPNLKGLKTTVRADLPYNQWIQFGKSIKDYILYLKISPTGL